MPFKSKAQRRFFYAKASEGGKEGNKFRKYLAEMEAKTPKGKKLPERVKTAGLFSSLFKRKTHAQKASELLRRAKKIQSGVKAPSVALPSGPEIVVPKPPTSPSRQRAIEQLREMKKTKTASQIAFEAGFFSEMDKIAKKKKKKKKSYVVHKVVGPTLGSAVSGGTMGAALAGKGKRLKGLRSGALGGMAGALLWRLTTGGYSKAMGVPFKEVVASASQVALESGFFSEAEKIAEKDSKADKVIKSLPGIGAIIGGAAGAASPKMFNPSGMFPEYIKSVGLRSAKGRALSALLGAGVVSGLGWTVPALKDLKDVAEGK